MLIQLREIAGLRLQAAVESMVEDRETLFQSGMEFLHLGEMLPALKFLWGEDCPPCSPKGMAFSGYCDLIGWSVSASAVVTPSTLAALEKLVDAVIEYVSRANVTFSVPPDVIQAALAGLASGIASRGPAVWAQVRLKCCKDKLCRPVILDWTPTLQDCEVWIPILNPDVNANRWPPVNDWNDRTIEAIAQAIRSRLDSYCNALPTDCPCP